MTKSTFPNEWLQPLVTEKVSEINQEAMKDFVTIEKKVFDVLQKNNLDMMEKLEKAKEALRFYSNADVYEYYDKYESTAVQHDGGQKAREALKEIER